MKQERLMIILAAVAVLGAVYFAVDAQASARMVRDFGITPLLPVFLTATLGAGPAIVGLVEAASGALGLPSMRLPSGASHDAMYLSRLCPTGMIFVPCERGVSHNEAENALPSDLAAGARVLTATLAELANR